MRNITMAQNTAPSYDRKYSKGGWKYDSENEKKDLKVMLDAAGIEPPASIVEVACGQGFHTNALHEMGYQVVGNDFSQVGIRNAYTMYPHITFIHGDSRELPEKLGREVFDGLIVRGHSHHHYDLPLDGRSQKNVDVVHSTQTMFDLVKPGGIVIMTIKTDFTGSMHPGGIINNEIGAYKALFSLFGDIILLADKYGTPIRDDAHARELGKIRGNRVVIVTRKDSPAKNRFHRQPVMNL